MTPDMINGAFEFAGAIAILNHCRALFKAKSSDGISALSTGFFFAWGLWNLFYYPHLDQLWSTAGGIAIVSANLLWIGLILKYRKANARTIS